MMISSNSSFPGPQTRAEVIDAVFNSPLDDGIELLPQAAGIYGMWNRATLMWNVGQSENIHARCLSHRFQMRAGNAGNQRIRRDVDRYGADSFFFMALELAASEVGVARVRELNRLEAWWVVQLKAHDERYGYNAEAGGLRTKGARFRDRERKLMRCSSGKYELLPGVNLYDPIDMTLLSTWNPGG